MKIGRRRVYHGVIDIPEGTAGEFRIEHERAEPGKKFPLVSARTAFMAGHRGKAVQYPEPTKWHRLCEGERGVWMTDLPIEQFQCDAALTRVRSGEVLIGGLGLGYAAVVLCRRPRIKRVVVVEKAPEVIALVADATRRTLGTDASKLEVVEADLFEYLKQQPLRGRGGYPFDWGFYDIWAADGEAVLHEKVIPLLKLSHNVVRQRPICWNEDVMRGQLRSALDGRGIRYLHERQGHEIPADWPGTAFPTVEQLATEMPPRDDDPDFDATIYHNWCVPFFQWVQRAQPSVEEFNEMAALYAGMYGTPAFMDHWRLFRLGGAT